MFDYLGQMTRLEFVGGPNVGHGDDGFFNAASQFGARAGWSASL